MTEPKPLSERQSEASEDDFELLTPPSERDEGGTTVGDKADIGSKLEREFDLGDEGDEEPVYDRFENQDPDTFEVLERVRRARYGSDES
jgi:hypothetical protein